MARGFSKVIITGNLTRDPELRATPSGAQVCSFSVAVGRSYRGNDGETKEQVSYLNCSAWGKTGETIAQYLHKGSGILVCGRLEQRSYEDKDGNKRSAVEIVVEDFNFIGGRSDGDGSDYSAPAGGAKKSSKKSSSEGPDDNIPDDVPEGEIDLSEIPF